MVMKALATATQWESDLLSVEDFRDPGNLGALYERLSQLDRLSTGVQNTLPSRQMKDDSMVMENTPNNIVSFVPRIRSQALPYKFAKRQEWEGIVQQICDDTNSFYARLIDKTNPSHPHEEGEFSIDEVSINDLDLLKVGGIFRWVIGYEDRSSSRQRVSKIVFRRLPQWTKRQLANIELEAEALSRELLADNG